MMIIENSKAPRALAALGLMAVMVVSCSKASAPEKPAGLTPSGTAPGATEAPGALPPPTAPPPPSEQAETVPAPVDPGQSVAGTIILPKARRRDVAKGDTIFIVARRAGGAPGPGSMLAVQKHQASEFPMPFSLSGRDAMVPGTPFEGPISIAVRVDKDGDAMTRRKGDVLGQVNGIKVGSQDVTISLDTLQSEDVTLGGGMPVARPPGLPPGHP